MRKFLKKSYIWVNSLIWWPVIVRQSKNPITIVPSEIQKILIIRCDRIGDLVLSTPAMKAIKQRFPEAEITVLVSEYAKDVLDKALFVDDILVYEKGMDLSSYNFDLVIDMIYDYLTLTAKLSASANAKYSIGFNVAGRGRFFNIPVFAQEGKKSFIELTDELLKPLGISAKEYLPEVSVDPQAVNEVKGFLAVGGLEEQPLICINPGGVYWTKRWPADRFAQLADMIIQKYQAKVVLMGSSSEQATLKQVQNYMQEEALVFVNKPLSEGIALLQASRLLICNNSGMLHVAAALNRPTVSTMGPANHYKWWPVGQKHIVLRKNIPCIDCGEGYCRIKTHDCMNLITVDDMMVAVRQHLENHI